MAPRATAERFAFATAAAFALAAAAAFASGFGPEAAGPSRITFQIATGPTAGTYFPVGQTLADLVSHPPGVGRCETPGVCALPGVIATAQASEGSVDNVRAVQDGRVASALAQADIVSAAAAGRAPFSKDGPAAELRAIANLYTEHVHLVAAKTSGIAGLADLRRKRVAVGPDGSGTAATARALLSAARIANRATLTDDGIEAAVQKLEAGEIDAFFFVGGAPVPAIADLLRRDAAMLVPIEGAAVDALAAKDPALVRTALPAEAYPGQPAVATLGVGAVWIVRADVPDDVVASITTALWNPANQALLAQAHPQGGAIRPDTAQIGLPVPLHPGAARVYAEPMAGSAP